MTVLTISVITLIEQRKSDGKIKTDSILPPVPIQIIIKLFCLIKGEMTYVETEYLQREFVG